MSQHTSKLSLPSKAKPHVKPFTGADEPRRSNVGTCPPSNLAFNRSLREIIVSVGSEPVQQGEATYTRVEAMVRGLYEKNASRTIK